MLQNILKDTELNIQTYQRVHGGDINEAYCLYGDDNKFFMKVNDAATYPQMFEKETAGLQALKSNNNIIIPQVLKTGIIDDRQYMLMEWIEKGSPAKDFWEKFGAGLASLHKKPQPYFGFKQDNYIGNLHQDNTHHTSWSSFYAERRIMPLVTILYDRHSFSKKDVESAMSFCKQLPDLFPEEPPALLHGDLWSGNYMVSQNGQAAIYDPAVYYGHREMDLGMTKLFGGFAEPFYNAYHEQYALEKNWRQRIPFTQLYPLLVHAALFGGHYISSARNIIRSF